MLQTWWAVFPIVFFQILPVNVINFSARRDHDAPLFEKKIQFFSSFCWLSRACGTYCTYYTGGPAFPTKRFADRRTDQPPLACTIATSSLKFIGHTARADRGPSTTVEPCGQPGSSPNGLQESAIWPTASRVAQTVESDRVSLKFVLSGAESTAWDGSL